MRQQWRHTSCAHQSPSARGLHFDGASAVHWPVVQIAMLHAHEINFAGIERDCPAATGGQENVTHAFARLETAGCKTRLLSHTSVCHLRSIRNNLLGIGR